MYVNGSSPSFVRRRALEIAGGVSGTEESHVPGARLQRVRSFLTDQPKMVLHAFLKEKTGLPFSEDFQAIGRVVDDCLVGVVGFEGFTGSACCMHMCGEGNWITREFISAAFRYPFETRKCELVFGKVPSGNQRALDIDRRLGFTDLIYIDRAHPDGGLYLLQMTKEQWRASKFYGKESPRSA